MDPVILQVGDPLDGLDEIPVPESVARLARYLEAMMMLVEDVNEVTVGDQKCWEFTVCEGLPTSLTNAAKAMGYPPGVTIREIRYFDMDGKSLVPAGEVQRQMAVPQEMTDDLAMRLAEYTGEGFTTLRDAFNEVLAGK